MADQSDKPQSIGTTHLGAEEIPDCLIPAAHTLKKSHPLRSNPVGRSGNSALFTEHGLKFPWFQDVLQTALTVFPLEMSIKRVYACGKYHSGNFPFNSFAGTGKGYAIGS